jgi:hypothetical protein
MEVRAVVVAGRSFDPVDKDPSLLSMTRLSIQISRLGWTFIHGFLLQKFVIRQKFQ